MLSACTVTFGLRNPPFTACWVASHHQDTTNGPLSWREAFLEKDTGPTPKKSYQA